MNLPRLRMIAGPNGSGKTTLLEYLRKQLFSLGHCQNPDHLQAHLQRVRQFDFTSADLHVQQETLVHFLEGHPLGQKEWLRSISVTDGVLTTKSDIDGGYFAAVLSDFIRQNWLATHQTFTFETVMSSPDKIQLLQRAKSMGYRTYLYYICTNSPLISRERVAVRVADGGHDVPHLKVEQRYHRSLTLLPQAIAATDRAYLFDNSGSAHQLIAEYENAKLKSVASTLPPWFATYVLNA